MVNITFKKYYPRFIFVASFHRACICLSLDLRTVNLKSDAHLPKKIWFICLNESPKNDFA